MKDWNIVKYTRIIGYPILIIGFVLFIIHALLMLPVMFTLAIGRWLTNSDKTHNGHTLLEEIKMEFEEPIWS